MIIDRIHVQEAPRYPVEDLAGLSPGELDDLLSDGFRWYRRSELPTWRMASSALGALIEHVPAVRNQAGLLVFATESVFDEAAEIRGPTPRLGVRDDLLRAATENGLDSCDITGVWLNGCANIAAALEYADAMMRARDYASAVVVTTDRFGTDESRLVPPKRSERLKLHGVGSDVATAMLLRNSSEGAGLKYLATTFASSGKCRQEHEAIGGNRNDFAYVLELAKLVRKSASAFKKQNGISLGDVTHVVLANYMRSELSLYLTGLGVRDDQIRMPSKADYGHAVSSDCMVSLRSMLAGGEIKNGERVAIASFGPFSIGITLFVYEEQ